MARVRVVQKGTLKGLACHQRRPSGQRKSAPLTKEQKVQRAAKAACTKLTLAQGIADWHANTQLEAEELAQKLGKSKRYVLNAMFQDGAQMVNAREKTNAFNAFKSIRLAQINEGKYCYDFLCTFRELTVLIERSNQNETSERLMDIQQQLLDEYRALSQEEKGGYVEQFEAEKSDQVTLRRTTVRGRVQTVANAKRNIVRVVCTLALVLLTTRS
jgi:hypothetical protein